MAIKKDRKLKVYGMGGYKGINVPTIVLKGKWLREMGFEEGTEVVVHCEDGVLTIVRRVDGLYNDKTEIILGK